MTNSFKRLLLKIAKLSRSDQAWVLKQLKPEQKEQFKQLQGEKLLQSAHRFAHLPETPTLQQTQQPNALPTFCHALSQYPALYIAMILKQGQFDWQQQFLASCEQNVDELLQTNTIKPATQFAVFKHWQTQLSFSEQLENSHD